jgi:hypothetical protein
MGGSPSRIVCVCVLVCALLPASDVRVFTYVHLVNPNGQELSTTEIPLLTATPCFLSFFLTAAAYWVTGLRYRVLKNGAWGAHQSSCLEWMKSVPSWSRANLARVAIVCTRVELGC